ncbi:hypothetical protein [Pseudoalteromonas lipolytica]|uniref:hypothetical protein n=1 Tax=Pseudoalteromonas lipolytica TaxID=570156 RepID=UPI00309FE50F
MQWLEPTGVKDFLSHHSSIRITDLKDSAVELAGNYELYVRFEDGRIIKECVELKIVIPRGYPKSIPTVYEISNKFPRTPDYHTYQDGSLCLTSEIRLRITCLENPKFEDFFKAIVEPCLLSIAYKVKFGTTPFGELEHGEAGLIDDYESLLGVNGKKSVMLSLKALSMKYRQANKLACPCNCGVRLGRCSFRFRLKSMRKVIKRKWYREHLASNFTPIPKRQKLIT